MIPRFALTPILILFVLAASACGGSGVRASATTIEIAALATSTAGDAISLASETDARSACPRETPDPDTCLAAVSDRWAPVDLAFSSTRLALGAWYAGTVAASRAEASGGILEAALAFAGAFARSYADLVAVAAALGLSLPSCPVCDPVR
tara:strand:- start:1060 stop:1509 length:450 start_codon:yes stop_codon:yes gene_type:complete